MQFTCVYRSGTKFGTGRQSSNYRARVISHGESVSISFDFRNPPPGKSHPGVTDAKVESLTLDLSQSEALQLAASIIAQAHHPMIHDSSASWILPESMPTLERNQWVRKLKFYLYRYRKELRIAIDNQTKFHVGRIEFEIDFRSHRTQAYTAAVWRLVDLPPGGVRTSVVGADDVSSIHCNDFFEIRGAEAITVTGIVPGEAK